MQKALLSSALIFNAIGFYSGDAGAEGHINCFNLMDTCKTSTMKCEGFISTGSDKSHYKDYENDAVRAAVDTCNAAFTKSKDQIMACREACDRHLKHYCTATTDCT